MAILKKNFLIICIGLLAIIILFFGVIKWADYVSKPDDVLIKELLSDSHVNNTINLTETDEENSENDIKLTDLPEKGTEHDIIISEYHARWGGIAYIDKARILVKDSEIGDRLKIKITDYTKSGLSARGTIIKRNGNIASNLFLKDLVIGKVYELTVAGKNFAGEYFALIKDSKIFIIGAKNIGRSVMVKYYGVSTSTSRKEKPFGIKAPLDI